MSATIDPCGPLTSASCIKRHPNNPLVTDKDCPYPSDLVFNAGICKWQGEYIMIFRNDYDCDKVGQPHGTNLGIARSPDGIAWTVEPEPIFTNEQGRELVSPLITHRDAHQEVRRIYDPRLSVIEGKLHLCFAVDTQHGVQGGIAVSDNGKDWTCTHLGQPDNRNWALFPEKVNGKYVRLDRPMPVYGRGGRDHFDVWLSDSPDLTYWGNHQLLLGVEDVPFANDKLGPAAPPVKTKAGWLATFHAVDRDENRGKNGWEKTWKKRYTAGIMLLDLDDPSKVLGYSDMPLIAPETDYESGAAGCNGFRNDVIFPGGMILEDDGEVKIYYGSADTFECLATAHVDDLIALCLNT